MGDVVGEGFVYQAHKEDLVAPSNAETETWSPCDRRATCAVRIARVAGLVAPWPV